MKKQILNWLFRDEIEQIRANLAADFDQKLYLLHQQTAQADTDLATRLNRVQELAIETTTRNVVKLRQEIQQLRDEAHAARVAEPRG